MSRRQPYVAVTGAAGFVGTAVTQELLRRERKVLAIDNLSVGHASRIPDHEDVVLARIDIRDSDAVHEVFREFRPREVIHLAAHHFIPFCVAHPAETIAVNVTGTQVVLDAAAAVGCMRLVFTSTGDVYVPSTTPHEETAPVGPNNVYGLSKATAEQLIGLWRALGATTEPVIVRLFNVIGPGETNPHVLPDIISWARQGDTLRLGNTAPKRDYIHVGDVAYCLVSMAEETDAADEIVNLANGRSWSVVDLVDALSAETGRGFMIETDPSKLRASDRPILQADVAKLDKLLPDRPRTSLRGSVRSLLQVEFPELLPS